jgi:uncharacterized membrane protein (DUF4010 family)
MVDPVAEPFQVVVVRVMLAFGIGALIGLEREQSESGGTFAGSRTFPLFALAGALVGGFYPTALPAVVVALAIPLTVAYGAKIILEDDIGLTTLTAGILTVFLGALATHSEEGALLAVIVGGVVTVTLSAKASIHEFAGQIEERERRASVKFILVVLVVYPLLPDEEMEALFGLNPRFVWLMVVFVTGLSFAAYVLSRVLGAKRGIAVTGVLGGFVSSTATTVSMADRTIETPSLYQVCAFSVVVASIVMFPRALLEVAVVNRSLLPMVALPLGVMTVVGIVVASVVYYRAGDVGGVESDIENPFRVRPALLFGAIFAAVLLVSESANEWFGASGIYATAFLSGLADVDAITLTLSRLAAEGAITHEVATTGIVLGAVANTLVKAALTWILGTRKLALVVMIVLGVVSVVGLLFVGLA